MLIPTDSFFKNIKSLTAKTENERIIKQIYLLFSNKPWYDKLYQDVSTKKRTSYTIMCKYPIDTTTVPSTVEGWQVKFDWPGKEQPTIEEAAEMFREKFKGTQWFKDVVATKDGDIEVTMKSWLNERNRLDFFENYPVRYGLEPSNVPQDVIVDDLFGRVLPE